MYTVSFRIENGGSNKVSAVLGDNILQLAELAGVSIDAPCSGNGVCGKCLVRLISGTVEAQPGPHLSKELYDEGWRLACQSKVLGDAVFFVPETAGSFKSNIQTADLSTSEELERYERAIDGIFSAGISRGVSEKGVGVAVDIGTTTVTAALLDLQEGHVLGRASAGNGQIVYGADVINRIIQQSKPGGVEKLRKAVREDTIIPLIRELCRQAGLKEENVKRLAIAGNTTMEHLFVGEDAQTIRLEPYVPAFLELTGKTAGELGVTADPGAPVIFAPNVGSYVGGDITAGILPAMLWHDEEMTLFIDLGTNGELVFGNREYMLTCACSAGPAFEGGDISCGMRATNGAIESCAIDKDTMEPTFGIIGDSKPVGLCGSGLIDTISELFRCGIINAKGKYVREGRRIRRDEYGGASYVLAFEDESGTGRPVELNESDLDNFIRAKGAIFSAIRTMLSAVGMDKDSIDRVVIAGGIGSGIDIEKAIYIGMLPRLPLEKYSYIGNSSLTGVCAMLLSDDAVEKVMEIGRGMTYLELSTEPGYMDEFVAACFLPHTDSSLFEED